MKPAFRFARRLAFGQALFEAGGWFWIGDDRSGSSWGDLFAATASLAIYGVLFTLLAFAFRARAVRWAGVGFVGSMPAQYLWIHGTSSLSTLDYVFIVLLGAAAVFAVLKPSEKWDRALRGILPAAWILTPLTAALWLVPATEIWRGEMPVSPPPVSAPNLVLISWDTVRADVLDLYGGRGAPTPQLDRLAAEGTVFDDAVSHAPITGPSHATMLTGLTPPEHGLRSNGSDVLAGSVRTLPEILGAAGYRTGGFAAAFPMAGRFGFHRGFEIYHDRIEHAGLARLSQLGQRNFWWLFALDPLLPRDPHVSVPAAEVNRRAAEWLEQLAGADEPRPFFLFVHYYDVHGPYAPAEPWRAQALAVADPRPVAADSGSELAMSLYRGEISQLDAQWAELRAALEKLDPGLRNTLIVITADHGECFGEGGIIQNHTPSVLEATQRVPLILREPGGVAGAARRETRTVTHVDLLPTFLEAAALPVPEGLPGRSLLTGSSEVLAAEHPVYIEAAQSHLGEDRKIAWRAAGWKYVQWHAGRHELWNFLDGVPEEQDRAAERADLCEELQRRLGAFLATIKVVEGGSLELSASDVAAMRALGYVGD
jgi:arylsulfatase A-like enzyme